MNEAPVVSAHEGVFAISADPINFYDFALLFRDRLKRGDALYLDGNVSSLYSRGLGRDRLCPSTLTVLFYVLRCWKLGGA